MRSSTPPGGLIGINTVAASSAENVGFAISIDAARPVINEIRSKPADKRAWVGVTFDSIDSGRRRGADRPRARRSAERP